MDQVNYLDATSSRGIPAGSSIRYECLACGETLPSRPEHSLACRCRNVIVDVDAGRVAVKNMTKFKAFSQAADAGAGLI